MPGSSITAKPPPIAVDFERTALLIIDMQRDFLEPGGFGETLGNDVSLLAARDRAVPALLAAARAAGLLVIHTREGHRPDLSRRAARQDRTRRAVSCASATPGPMGRILVRGEAGHDIIPELYPLAGEPVIDKPGKGAFYATDLDLILRNRGIEHLIVCGVTTEVCVNTTVREANDRGYRCLVLGRLLRLLLPGIPRDRAAHDRGAGRHLRLGLRLGSRIAALDAPRRLRGSDRDARRAAERRDHDRAASTTTRRAAHDARTAPGLWTPGDWNAFFGFGTNILVNLLVLTGLLRFVLKMPDELVFGRILPAIGLMLCLSTIYYAWLAYRLAHEDRPRRRLRAAVGHQRAAHVRRHVRDHAADLAQDRRSDQGLGGRADLGVHPELRADDRRLHRARASADHAARGAARHAGRRLDHLHLDAAGAGDVHDAGDRPHLLRHHPGELVRRRALSERHSGRPGGDRGRHAHRLGLEPVRPRTTAA